MLDRVKNILHRVRNVGIRKRIQKIKTSKRYTKVKKFIYRKPFTSFFVVLGILLLLIIGGNIISGLGQEEAQAEKPVKSVDVYGIGTSPKVTLQAQVDQKGVIQIVAQSPGIVQSINVNEGDIVQQGTELVSLSSNYQGGNAPGLQAQLAGVQYKNVKETYQTQKDLIGKQREVADKSATNADELRKISEQSVGETRDLLNLNETILDSLDQALQQAELIGDPVQILEAQGAKAQAQAGVNQLRSALRNLEYQTNTDKPVNQLTTLQKDITIKQLEVQDKALDLQKEVSAIQYNLALVQASLMRPAAPFAAKVERIHVGIGESVNPGDVIATISCLEPTASITVFAPREIAMNISRVEPSILHINGKPVSLVPSYISSVATEGQLHTIIYNLPDGLTMKVTDSSFLPVEVPVGYADTNSAVPFIPVDSVYQSQNSAYVYVAKDGVAQNRELTLGGVFGSFVEVVDGLTKGDQVILDRNIVSGDKIQLTTKQ